MGKQETKTNWPRVLTDMLAKSDNRTEAEKRESEARQELSAAERELAAEQLQRDQRRRRPGVDY